jgi:hypothetical protein
MPWIKERTQPASGGRLEARGGRRTAAAVLPLVLHIQVLQVGDQPRLRAPHVDDGLALCSRWL